ncbi:MAG: short-chain dehydrogenase [Gammaproteobacteria bacterium BRH_c0]|nr:MAG: short-chain dehydrogenase [Gammaproteobacteria bacterium BRH_c0]
MSSTEDTEFTNRVAFITGGGRGFGKAFGQALAQRGARVVLADIDPVAGEQAAAELRANGGKAEAVVCDVANEEQVEHAINQVAANHGGIDILINNAGLHSAAYNEPLAVSGIAKLRRLFDVNLMGVIICSMAARKAMSGRPGAAILNISSAAAYGCQTAYGVSKLAVRGLTVTLAGDFREDGIRVNAIAPGLIFTDTIRAELSPELVSAVKKQQILDREGEEKDIVEAMLYLCSARASFITGETLRVSGGFTLQV